jgi:hypothetical protein
VEELDLSVNVGARDPPYLSLPHHVHRFVTLNGSSCRCKRAESLLGVNSPFDGAVVLLNDVI